MDMLMLPNMKLVRWNQINSSQTKPQKPMNFIFGSFCMCHNIACACVQHVNCLKWQKQTFIYEYNCIAQIMQSIHVIADVSFRFYLENEFDWYSFPFEYITEILLDVRLNTCSAVRHFENHMSCMQYIVFIRTCWIMIVVMSVSYMSTPSAAHRYWAVHQCCAKSYLTLKCILYSPSLLRHQHLTIKLGSNTNSCHYTQIMTNFSIVWLNVIICSLVAHLATTSEQPFKTYRHHCRRKLRRAH